MNFHYDITFLPPCIFYSLRFVSISLFLCIRTYTSRCFVCVCYKVISISVLLFHRILTWVKSKTSPYSFFISAKWQTPDVKRYFLHLHLDEIRRYDATIIMEADADRLLLKKWFCVVCRVWWTFQIRANKKW